MDKVIYDIKGLLYDYLCSGYMSLNDFFSSRDIHKYASYFINKIYKLAKKTDDLELLAIIEEVKYKDKNFKKIQREDYARIAKEFTKKGKELLDLMVEYPDICIKVFDQVATSLPNNESKIVKLMIGEEIRVNGFNTAIMTDKAIRELSTLRVDSETVVLPQEVKEKTIEIINTLNLTRNAKVVKQLMRRIYKGTFDIHNVKSR